MLGFCHFPSSEHAGYRFGFNGIEKDDEVYGNGNYLAFDFRGYDPRIARFTSPDPLIIKEQRYPWYTPYQFAGNKPIQFVDLYGLQEGSRNDLLLYGKAKLTTGKIGIEFTIAGIEFKFSYSASGATESSLEAGALASQSGYAESWALHRKTVDQEGGWSIKVGYAGGESSNKKETVTGWHSKEGFVNQREETKKTENASAGPIHWEEGGDNMVIKNTADLEVNLLLFGFGVEGGAELYNEPTAVIPDASSDKTKSSTP